MSVKPFTKSKTWKLGKSTKVQSINTYQSLKYCSDDNVELVKIALKKEKDRKDKLEKFLDKFHETEEKEKKSAKQIKAYIIELKGVEPVQKFKIHVDPSIYVDNELKTQTRQFLCHLLNTFYASYEKYQTTNRKISEINESLSYLIRHISYAEEMLMTKQRNKIVEEVKLEGELLFEKNKLKEILNRKKRVEQEFLGVNEAYETAKAEYDEKCSTNLQIKNQLSSLKCRLSDLESSITEHENIRKNCRDQISEELTYQSMFKHQFHEISERLEKELEYQKRIKKQLLAVKARNRAKKENLPVCESIKHNVKVEMMKDKGKYYRQI